MNTNAESPTPPSTLKTHQMDNKKTIHFSRKQNCHIYSLLKASYFYYEHIMDGIICSVCFFWRKREKLCGSVLAADWESPPGRGRRLWPLTSPIKKKKATEKRIECQRQPFPGRLPDHQNTKQLRGGVEEVARIALAICCSRFDQSESYEWDETGGTQLTSFTRGQLLVQVFSALSGKSDHSFFSHH